MSQLDTTNFVSIKYILNRLLRDEPYITEINLGDAIEWAGDCLNALGITELFSICYTTVKIKDYRGAFPSNFKSIEAIREVSYGKGLKVSLNKFPHSSENYKNALNSLGITIDNGVIFTGFKEGEIEIKYTGYNLDEQGYPKINDDERLIRCIYYYIAEKKAYQKFVMGKLPQQIYDRIEQQSLFYLSSARYKGKTPSKLKMQSILDQQVQLVPNQDLYSDNFVTLQNIEKLKINGE